MIVCVRFIIHMVIIRSAHIHIPGPKIIFVRKTVCCNVFISGEPGCLIRGQIKFYR